MHPQANWQNPLQHDKSTKNNKPTTLLLTSMVARGISSEVFLGHESRGGGRSKLDFEGESTLGCVDTVLPPAKQG